ncbi:chloride channel protein [Planktomarina temperata]|nr:chloride channel protein [Planktomarina temperata]MDC1333655.1 chloride channel protein [Planktomarina temperata]
MQQSCQHVKNKLKFQIGPFNNLAKGYEIKHFELKSSSKSILSIYASSGIGAAIGVIVSVIVGGFVYLVQFAQNLDLFGDARFIQLGAIVLDIKICVFIILAAIAILILRKFFGITKWNGPADSIYAAHQNTDELDIRTGVASTMAALVSAAGYASVGQYGPLVHFGATAGTAAKKVLNLRIGTDVVIGCGVAAAISSGFAAPIAGVIFAHEAILRHYAPSAMAPIATSAIVAAAMESYFFNIPHPLEIVEVGPTLVSTFLPVAIAGVVFGLVAIIFMHSLRYFAGLNARLNRPVYQTIFVAVLAVIIVSLFIPEALGLGTGVLASILNIQGSLGFILSLLLVKIVITSLCLGFGFFGGVFSPSLLIGAATGAVLAKCFALIGLPGLGMALALAGMASVAACVVGAPLATIFIVLELTLSYEFTLITLLAVIVSQVISSNLFGNSFFDRQLLDRGIDLKFGRGKFSLSQARVVERAQYDFVSTPTHSTVAAVLKLLSEAGQTEAYCLSQEGNLEGKLSIIHLMGADKGQAVREIMDRRPLRLKADQNMLEAIEVASGFVGETIPVIEEPGGKMIGVVSESDLFSAYLDIQEQVQDVEK